MVRIICAMVMMFSGRGSESHTCTHRTVGSLAQAEEGRQEGYSLGSEEDTSLEEVPGQCLSNG